MMYLIPALAVLAITAVAFMMRKRAPGVWIAWLMYAVIVGSILIAINHGDALARGEWGTTRLIKMALTVFVPYTVSTLSSVQAMQARKGEKS